ncbi:alanine racemase [Alphaproteobacteria bacterium]|nr:alanine racemase [Alphaproteobacteria bacterium]
MKIENLEELVTPCLILDKSLLEKNCQKARYKCRELNTILRPHVKTPKSIEVAKIALDNQEGPITVSTLNEAEYFANSGFKDILYAVCVIPKKLNRLNFIQQKYRCVIRMVIDSVFIAQEILNYSKLHNANFEILIEIDCGEGRSGLNYQDENIREISKVFALNHQTKLLGVLTHAGHSYSTKDKSEIISISNIEREEALASTKNLLNFEKKSPIISIGSTPTMFLASKLDGISEVRAGIYMFWDLAQASRGICKIEDIALTVLASVIGHNHQRKRIIIDAGSLALSKDISANKFMPEAGYGLICNPQTAIPFKGLYISELHQEHGSIEINSKDWFDKLPIGSLVRILPNHACLTCAAYENYNVLESGNIIDNWSRTNGW